MEVPNVTGMTQAEAIAKLKQKGFDSINKAEGTSNEVDKGKVISQTPEGGTVAPADYDQYRKGYHRTGTGAERYRYFQRRSHGNSCGEQSAAWNDLGG